MRDDDPRKDKVQEIVDGATQWRPAVEPRSRDASDEIANYSEPCHDAVHVLDRCQAGRTDGSAERPVDFTEDALAAEFTSRYGADLRYVAAGKQWFYWSGTHWQRDTTLLVRDRARLVCRDAAARSDNRGDARKLSASATVTAVENFARASRHHAATADEWDRDTWALNTPGGVIDLRTGTRRRHDRADRMTKITTATPEGDCPMWRAFLATVTDGDPELQAYLARMAGYTLTGETSEHALFFLYGTGANGKSVFVNTLVEIFGDYATTAPMETFMMTRGERHPTDLAGLRGARLVTSTETEEGRRWAESKLKAVTGGDKISARKMREDFSEFTPQFKLVVAGNHKPAIRNVDEAMRRRLHLVPFTVTIPKEQRDQALQQKLLAEREGILAWAVAGCLEWQRIGLNPPASVVNATHEYFEAEDAVGRWLDERCRRTGCGFATTSALYADWQEWAETRGELVGSLRRFSENLFARGLVKGREAGTGRHGFRGLTLISGSNQSVGTG